MTKLQRKAAMDVRRATFLRVLAATGSVHAAATAATPNPKSSARKGHTPGLSTFQQIRTRDPRFAAEWDKAVAIAIGRVETEVMRRAMTPTRRPVFSKGELVGHTDEYDNRLLVALARRLNPDDWSDRSKVEHSGVVEHRLAPGSVVLAPDDIQLLPAAQREVFYQLLEVMVLRKQRAERVERDAARHAVIEGVATALPAPMMEATDGDV
jgi:hypothetical protein